MNGLVSVYEWLGYRGEPLSPELMQFTIKPATSCRGCVFDGQHSNVCSRACDAASHAGLPWCEEGFIYVPKDEDTRQMDLLKEH